MIKRHDDEKKTVEAIIERLKTATESKSDSSLAEKLGYQRQAVYEWKKRGSVPLQKVFEVCPNVREEWILTGEGEMLRVSDGRQKSPSERATDLLNEAIKVLRETHEDPETIASEISACVPHYLHCIAAGLPADSSCIAEKMVLPTVLVKHPKDTYAVTVSGDSMLGAGIEEGDILIVDRAIEPGNKSIVIASINGEQTVKRLKISNGGVSLMPENNKYPEVLITREMDFRTLGVVTWVIRKAG
jgi:DNA polymerase V